MTTIETTLRAERALSEALAEYAGRWIALRDEKIVVAASTLGELLAQIEETEVDEIFEVPDGQAAVGFFFCA